MKCVAERISGGGPPWAHEARGAPRWVAHLVHLPLILFAPEILKYSEQIILKFQSVLRTFILVGHFFIAWEIQKIDNTWHFILFN